MHVAAHRERDQQQARRAPAVAPGARGRARARARSRRPAPPGRRAARPRSRAREWPAARRRRGRTATRSGRPAAGRAATPRLPPTENTDMAVERRSPESQAANLLASGWKAATPRLDDRARTASATANVCAKASAPMPSPATAGPGDQQPLAAARVEEVAEDRLHDRRGDRRGEHDRRRARVREVQLVAQERQQRGHAALREVGDHVAAREQPERAQRPAQSRRGDGGGGHTVNGILAAMPMPPPGVYAPLLTLYDDGEEIDLAATAALRAAPGRRRSARPRRLGLDGRVPPAHPGRAPGAARGGRSRPARARRCWRRSARPRSATPSRSPSTRRPPARPA